MDNVFACRLILILALAIGSARSAESPAGGYEALIQQGKSQLQAGSAEQAAASGKAAIKMSTERWEAYALVGGALMNLKRYEAAADSLSEAIKRAPEVKQPALRDLRRQCLLAESGSAAAANTPAPASTTTQAEIVLWKSIENSTNVTDFQTYLDQYPHGAFVLLAQRHLVDANTQAERERQKSVANLVWMDSTIDLMWPKRPPPKPDADWDAYWSAKTFDQAGSYCAQLRLLGRSDWRLPDVHELQAIYASNQGQEAVSIASPNSGIGRSYRTVTPGERIGEHIVFHKGQVGVKDSQSSFSGLVGWFTMALCVRNIGERP